MVKFEIVGKDETEQKHTVFVDEYGKLRTGVVEYIKLIGQHNSLDGVVTGLSATPTTHNHILVYPLPLHSNAVGDDYTESTLTVTAAAGTTNSGTNSVSATFVSTLRNKITKIKGDVIIVVNIYYNTDGSEGTVSIDSITVEFGKIDTETGNSSVIDGKTVNVGRSTANSPITDSIALIFGNKEFTINEGERLYLTVTVNYTLTVDATGATADVTRTATVRIDHYRGSDDVHILLPVVM